MGTLSGWVVQAAGGSQPEADGRKSRGTSYRTSSSVPASLDRSFWVLRSGEERSRCILPSEGVPGLRCGKPVLLWKERSPMGPEGSLSEGLLWKTHTHRRPSKDGNCSFWKTLTVRPKAQQGSQ